MRENIIAALIVGTLSIISALVAVAYVRSLTPAQLEELRR